MVILMQFTSMGILGAALSTVLCYAVAGIADTVYVIRKTRMNISYTDTFAKPLFSSIVMGFAVFAVYTLGSKLGHPTLGNARLALRRRGSIRRTHDPASSVQQQ